MDHITNFRIKSAIDDFIRHSPENTLKNAANEKAFEDCLVGFSSGADPLYRDYKRHVGPFHWTPLEVFTLAFPGVAAEPDELAVISWILPQKEATKKDNRAETRFPSERWARARFYGEEVNNSLRNHVMEALLKEGIQSVAPQLLKNWERKISDYYGYASNWSERHAAYASGLGTFGLCDGLITPKGKAMRTGSVVVRVELEPTPRPYSDHNEYCLFHSKGICKKCAKRCPVGAISESGHDKVKCRQYIRTETNEFIKSNFGFDAYGCGLCQTGVPCESRIPVNGSKIK